MKTLVDVMLRRAKEKPHSDAFLSPGENGAEDVRLTSLELDRGARRVAACLQSLGLENERVLLLYPPGTEFIVAFLGCLYAGVTAVPAHPPGHARSMKRLASLVADCAPATALTTGPLKARLQKGAEPSFGNLWLIDTQTLAPGLEDRWRHPEISPDRPAFLQYTSGSTASPKGVIVTHGNLMYTEELIQRAFGQSGDSVVVNWLPFYHDMGLIGGVLQPLFSGGRCILMPPMQFLREPVRWLRAISKYRASTSGGPNFAYEYCAQKITAEQREGLDLSCWRVAFCGSEPVRATTLENFTREFALYGFSEEAFQPCYGLAESTLLVSGFRRGNGPVVRAFYSDSLLRNQAVPAPERSNASRKLVGSGGVSDGDKVVIVETTALQPCAERTIGEIWVSGDAVAAGYWRNPAETDAVFRTTLAGEPGRSFLRTGDLGFLDNGELFITGRLKDLIISRGVNHFPQDIEETAGECHACLRGASGAAFSLVDETQPERLVIVHEAEKRAGVDYDSVIQEIRSTVARRHDLQPDAIVLVRAGTIPKTPSGKVQRHACRDAFLNGSLSEIAAWRRTRSEAPAVLTPLTVGAFESLDDVGAWLVRELSGLLGVDAATIDPEFPILHLGLDSLTAVELTHRIETLGVTLPVSLLLETATISDVAAEILSAPIQRVSPASAPAVPAGPCYPLSYGQRALWFLQRLEPDNSSYNLSSAFRIRGPLDRAALRRAFQSLIDRHVALRTTFEEAEGRPLQRVHEKSECAFAEHDASAWAAGRLDEEIVREMNARFDPEAGPLLRVALYERADAPILQFTVHHMVADFRSLTVVLDEIGRLYAAEAGLVKNLSLPPAPAYSDFVQREAELLEGPEGERLWGYWKERLSGEIPVSALPTDRPRSERHGNAGGTARARLGGELVAELSALARERGATLYMALLAGFYALLFRYSDCDDLLIGSPALGRMSADFSRLVGYCVNPLPLRVRIDSSWSFAELVAAVRETVSGAFAHQQFPFPLMVEKLHPGRTSLRTALFQTLFTFLGKAPGHAEGIVPLAMGEPGSRVQVGGLEFEAPAMDDQPLDFDLAMTAGLVDGGDVAVALRYQRDLFEPSTMVRMLTHWKAMLTAMAQNSGIRISDCQFLSASEIAEVVSVGAGLRVNYSAEGCITGALEDFVRRDPERVAVIFGGEEFTQDQINRRANRLARHLLTFGGAPDVPIGICLERSAEMVVALIAILKTGAAYVPLDPNYPEERLHTMVRDAGIAAIVTTGRRAGLFSGVPTATVCIDDQADVIAALSSENLPLTAGPDHIAYILYTSGSTGRPKGVMVTQRNVMNLFAAMDALYGTEPGVWLAVTSISFDISVVEIFWTLSRGSQVVVSPDRLPGGESRYASLHGKTKGKITHLQGTPSTIRMLCAEPETAAIVASVEKLVLGGEAVTPALLDSLPAADGRDIYDQYGPTETTVWATAGKVCAGMREVTLGRPIGNAAIYILDRFLNPTPVGIPGEICIAGEGLARGYLGRPDATAEKFIPDFLSGKAGARLYRTGDRGRWDRDGNVEFLGRFDNQVKVRGHRIECGEIETCLAAHPGVREVAVNPVSDSAGEVSIVAYIVPAGDAPPSIRELRDFIGARLPEYMVPSYFATLRSFPQTPGGKLDRKRLPAAERMEIEPGGEFVPPRSEMERELAGMWAELLKVDRVGVYTNFFAAGGHSLLATQVVARVRTSFGVEMSLRQLFESPTVAGLAEWLGRARNGGREAPLPEPEARGGDMPLSFAQQRTWQLQRQAPESAAFNLSLGLRLSGEIEPMALEWVVNEIVRRHEVLRTAFPVQDGEVVARIAPEAEVSVEEIDLRGTPSEKREAAVAERACGEAAALFDLAKGPMLRVRLLRAADQDHVLLVVMHRMVSDEWSMKIFVDELTKLYRACTQGEESGLEDLKIQYADYAAWQRKRIQDEGPARQREYRKLVGLMPLNLPTDHPRPMATSGEGASIAYTVDADLTRKLKDLSERQGVTLFMALMGAFQALLSGYAGQEDVAVATPAANRSRAETQGLIGPFANILALRTKLDGDPNFTEVLKRVRQATLDAFQNQEVPPEVPPLNAMLALSEAEQREVHLPGLTVSEFRIDTGTARFDLLLTLREGGETLSGELTYARDLFEEKTAQHLLEQLSVVLEKMAGEPESRIGEVAGEREMLNPAE